jgi:DNA-binding response OmpR family regulator
MHERILAIDDDARLIAVLSIRLQASGYDVQTAISGEEGLLKAKSYLPHLIILDINMPGIDGYEVCRLLRSDTTLCRTPVIVMSAVTHDAARRAALEAGANMFIAKPYDASDVLKAIARMTGMSDGLVPIVPTPGDHRDAT